MWYQISFVIHLTYAEDSPASGGAAASHSCRYALLCIPHTLYPMAAVQLIHHKRRVLLQHIAVILPHLQI